MFAFIHPTIRRDVPLLKWSMKTGIISIIVTKLLLQDNYRVIILAMTFKFCKTTCLISCKIPIIQ